MVCDKLIENEKYSFICKRCLCSAEPAPESPELLNRLYRNFKAEDVVLSELYALYSSLEIDETKIMKAVYNLKYHSIPMIGCELGLELGELLKYEGATDFTAILPLPLHPARKRERGYNQADFIADGLSKALNIPNDTKILKRKNYTLSQTQLKSDERKTNVKNVKTNVKIVESNNDIIEPSDEIIEPTIDTEVPAEDPTDDTPIV